MPARLAAAAGSAKMPWRPSWAIAASIWSSVDGDEVAFRGTHCGGGLAPVARRRRRCCRRSWYRNSRAGARRVRRQRRAGRARGLDAEHARQAVDQPERVHLGKPFQIPAIVQPSPTRPPPSPARRRGGLLADLEAAGLLAFDQRRVHARCGCTSRSARRRAGTAPRPRRSCRSTRITRAPKHEQLRDLGLGRVLGHEDDRLQAGGRGGAGEAMAALPVEAQATTSRRRPGRARRPRRSRGP